MFDSTRRETVKPGLKGNGKAQALPNRTRGARPPGCAAPGMRPLLCLSPWVLAAAALAQPAAPFQRIELQVDDVVGAQRTLLAIEADGSLALSGLAQPPGRGVNLPPPLGGQLSAGERQALEDELRSGQLDGLPQVLPNPGRVPDDRFQLLVARPQGALRVQGAFGHYGAFAPRLRRFMGTLEAVLRRLRAEPARRAYLEITALPGLPSQLRSDQDLRVVVEGPGVAGLVFDRLEAWIHPDRITVRAVARPAGAGPAQPFRAALDVPRAGAAGPGTLMVLAPRGPSAFPTRGEVRIVAAEDPQDGVFHGTLRDQEGGVWLELGPDRPRLPLTGSQAQDLRRFAGERVRFRGHALQVGAPERGVAVDALEMPALVTFEGEVLDGPTRDTVELANGQWVYLIGPARGVLAAARGRWVRFEAWSFPAPGEGRPGRPLLPRAWVERVEGTAREAARLKRGLFGNAGQLQPGERVWVTRAHRRLLRRHLELITDAGLTGSVRLGSVELGRALPAPGTSSAGLVGGVSGPP